MTATTTSPNPYEPSLLSENGIETCELIRTTEGVGIDFDQRPEDLNAFVKFHYMTKGGFYKQRRRGLIIAALCLLLSGIHFALVGVITIVNVFLFLLAVLYAVFFVFLMSFRISRVAKQMQTTGRNLGMIGRQRIRLTKRGILRNNAGGEFLNYWEGIEDIQETPKHLFAYVSGFSAIIVPKRSFASKDECEEFREVLRSRTIE